MRYIPRNDTPINFREITNRLLAGRQECSDAGYHLGEMKADPLFRDGKFIDVYECQNCGGVYDRPSRPLGSQVNKADNYLLAKV